MNPLQGQPTTTATASAPALSIPIAGRRKPKPESQFHLTRNKPGEAPKSRGRGAPYIPGFADHLLAPRAHVRVEDLAAVSFEISDAGALMLVEHTRTGHSPRSRVREFPFEVVLLLPSGEEIYIEVTSLGVRDAFEDPEIVSYRTPEEIGTLCTLVNFGPEPAELFE